MADINANVVVSMPSQLFTAARSFKALSGGKIYIGKIDTDPSIPSNQIQVYISNEDGSSVPVAQPLLIGTSGYPVYNGSIAKFVTQEGHSMAVYDAYGAQQFYFPNVLKYDPDQFEQRLSQPDGASMIGTSNGSNVEAELGVLGNGISANDIAKYSKQNMIHLINVDYKLRARQSVNVSFYGDSITAGYDQTSTDSVPPGQNGDWARHAVVTYPQRFVLAMSQRAGILINPNIRAYSGQTAKQAYDKPEWQTNPNCDIAIIMYGLNDAAGADGATQAEYLDYMEKHIRRFIDWGMGVVVCAPACGGFGTGQNSGIPDTEAQRWGRQIKNLSDLYGCAYFNGFETQYNRIYGSIQSDDVHFNSAGYSRHADSLASMFLAGGLMPHHKLVSSEFHMWPGQQSDMHGYYDVYGNINTSRNALFGNTLQGILGSMPSGTQSAMSFSFYLDAEAAEVDIVGTWGAGSLLSFSFSDNSTVVPYYAFQGNRSSVLAYDTVESFGTQMTASPAAADGAPKRLGKLVGRGWKTILFFNSASSTSSCNIQGVTVRPVPVHMTIGSPGAVSRGYMETINYRYPVLSGFPGGSTLTAAQLSTIYLPTPYDLLEKLRDGSAQAYDIGFAKLIIKGNGGTGGNCYLEAVVSKTTIGNDYTVDVLHTVGTWPAVITITGVTANDAIDYQAAQLANGMPVEVIRHGNPANNGLSMHGNRWGSFLKIVFNWTPDNVKTGFYHLSFQSPSSGMGGAAYLAASDS